MNPATLKGLSMLDEADWFCAVGRPLQDADVMQINSWEVAIASCASPDWEDVGMEVANVYREALAAGFPDRWNDWNHCVERIRPVVAALVDRKSEPTIRANNLPKIFKDCVRWDILGFALECEYSDIMPVGFYKKLASYYAAGHFPCGWEGGFPPEGRLIIY